MPKTEMLRLRLSPDEKLAFERAANISGLPVSGWVRERLRRAARIELEDAGERVPFARLPGTT
jgi:uncharacterized protein (DUF1778 family)